MIVWNSPSSYHWDYQILMSHPTQTFALHASDQKMIPVHHQGETWPAISSKWCPKMNEVGGG